MTKHDRAMMGACATVALLGCGEGEATSDAFVVRDSLGITVAENVASSVPACVVPAEPRVSIGTAEGPEEYQLFRVFGATRLSDGRIALVNQGSQELRYYDADGTHLMSAGREGEGPGEFRDAFYLWALPGDTIWVGDYRPFQFLVFAPNGEWVRTVRPRPLYPNTPGVMAVLDDGRSILGDDEFDRTAMGFTLRRQPVIIHGPDGTVVDSLGVYPDGRWGRVGDDPTGPFLYPFFESFTRVDAKGLTLVLGHGSEPELLVYDLSQEPKLERIIRWDPGDRSVTSDDVEAARDELRARYAGMDPAMAARLLEPLVSDERPVSDVFPAFTGIRLAEDGRIWIRDYPRPNSPVAQRWIGFDADGRLDCSVSLDVDQIYEFGRDYVLALDRDELGVERVQLYDVSSPMD